MKKYDVAAYIWPAYIGEEPRTIPFWPEKYGEWQTVKNSKPKPNGYYWNRKPLWGYVNEANPAIMEMEIEEAVRHGVNVFIYDWYWFDGRPFLENCLDNGFLKARNRNKMKFYLMWANHSANQGWDIRVSDDPSCDIWDGAVNRANFDIVCDRVIEKYFITVERVQGNSPLPESANALPASFSAFSTSMLVMSLISFDLLYY